ncbi:OprO/OprP family phosphate-selective porin [Sphingorhabdus sp. SMR4y]|uniref:OprO/OprP family phosphate-selective porin n=1 Tax=Sphingorhabdus sp. SMR4y TaxID=2584094 RepID=UPI001641DC32|nr:OprO/OprP family phosphate-selective porin [Sphingorhabdus sp. SMR4y]
MLKTLGLLAGTAAIGLYPATAMAAPITDEQAAALLSKLEQLEREVADLKAQLGSVQQSQVASTSAIAATEAKLAATEEKLEQQKPVKVAFKGAPEIKGEDGWSFKPRGRMLYDFGSVNAPDSINDAGLGFANEARRIRLGASGSIPGGFGYKLEADFAGNEIDLTDAYFTYDHGGLTVTAGQHNTFQGLEELSSSNDTSFIERAAYTDAFGFERRVGLSAQYGVSDLLFQAGVFTANIDDLNNDEDNSIGFDVRAVAMPKFGDTQTHFGASYHYRDLGDATSARRYRQRPAVHFTDTRFIDTGNISGAESETSYGLEAAVISGRFHATAEGHWLNLDRAGALADPTFFGGAVEAGFFLTDDTRGYKNGVFKGVKVANPVGQGGLGAWQVNLRYDRLDLVDAGVVGGTQDAYQASLIWTPVNYVRFLLSYSKIDYSDAAILAAGDDSYNVDAFAGRFQISF